MISMMNLKTLPHPVKHKINIRHDNQRFEALSLEMEAFLEELESDMIAQYVYSHLEMLRCIAPVLDLIVDGNMILIVEESRILTVDRAGMNRTQITKAMICTVKS